MVAELTYQPIEGWSARYGRFADVPECVFFVDECHEGDIEPDGASDIIQKMVSFLTRVMN